MVQSAWVMTLIVQIFFRYTSPCSGQSEMSGRKSCIHVGLDGAKCQEGSPANPVASMVQQVEATDREPIPPVYASSSASAPTEDIGEVFRRFQESEPVT